MTPAPPGPGDVDAGTHEDAPPYDGGRSPGTRSGGTRSGSTRSGSTRSADVATAALDQALRDTGLNFNQVEPGTFSVELPGEHRLKTTCWLTIGRHGLSIEAFVMRRPDENRERVYAYLLTRNAGTYAVSWSIDDHGDVYLSGRLPLEAISPPEIDRVLGSVLSNADDHFDHLLQLGFGSSIRREWAWRTKNGESLRNLEAFRDFVFATQDRQP